ncbi:MAG: heme biosynthesis HemY N-terminal domain-containing protein [Pseudomonadales bacterium]|nr:heme biosynthesis protein HemY [Pseudomonadales bacterium]
MKLGILLLIVAVVLGGLVGTLVVRDPGYVLVSYADMALETSLWFALLILLTAYVLIRLMAFLFNRSRATGGQVSGWLSERRSRNARTRTVQGLLLMAEGEWAQARKLLVASASEASAPLINYLNAARAAHELGDTQGRDDLLRQAHESTPGSRFAVGLTQAELQMAAGQWEQCLATLLQLRSEAPKHRQVLVMLSRCYQELKDWQALIELGPALIRQKVDAHTAEFNRIDVDALLEQAWHQRLGQAGAVPRTVWSQMPRDLQKKPTLLVAYARALIEAGESDEAEVVLRGALSQHWDDTLVELYGSVQGSDTRRQLVAAESWLKQRPNDAPLLLALGRICLMNSEWEKAREYLELSLRMSRSTQVYGELGRLCLALGESERGAEYLRLANPGLPDLPLPDGQASDAQRGS